MSTKEHKCRCYSLQRRRKKEKAKKKRKATILVVKDSFGKIFKKEHLVKTIREIP